MSNQSSVDLARKLLAEAMRVELKDIANEASIETTLNWDSLVHAQLMVAIEDHLGRELTSDEVLSVESLQDVAKLLS